MDKLKDLLCFIVSHMSTSMQLESGQCFPNGGMHHAVNAGASLILCCA